ncbi:MAG: hypothetical protein JXP34_22355 [Planctomycetes bacterium]|nr:hypothetical protein [Planctomycetota bacterium]
MELRERMHDEGGRPGAGEGGGGSNLSHLRQLGERYLAAADAAIARSLSGDSQAFLSANRQQGGE